MQVRKRMEQAIKAGKGIRLNATEIIAVYHAKGMKKAGRPSRGINKRFREIYEKWKCGELKAKEAQAASGYPASTFYRYVKKMEEINQ